jgi:thioredoxin reductase/ferredoxin
MESLRDEGFEAFFFAIGAHHSYQLNIPGEDEFNVLEAIDLLRRVARGERRKPGKKVVVIGGGNVAIDAARTSLRLGANDVTIAYRRTRSEMPADEEEVEQAEEEGIRMAFLTVPEAVIGKDGQTIGLKCLRAKMVKKEGSDRMIPLPIDGSRFIMDADVVISAIGQQVDRDCLEGVNNLQWTRRNTIDINTISMETNVPGVFAAGDAVTGPATVIEAIGGGKRAADAIDRYLNGIPQPNMPPVPVRRARVPHLCSDATEKMILKRPEMPLLRTDRRRTTFQQVEMGYSEEQARKEALRCLRCDICRRCGRCVEICRDKMKVDALQLGYLDFDNPGETDLRLTQERCILCGACATNCPNGALKIEDINGERVLTICGTELNRQKIQICASCGTPVGTRRYFNFIHHRIRPDEDIRVDNFICDVCLRKKSAADNID